MSDDVTCIDNEIVSTEDSTTLFLNEWTLTHDMAMIQPSFTSSKWNMGETALRFLLCN